MRSVSGADGYSAEHVNQKSKRVANFRVRRLSHSIPARHLWRTRRARLLHLVLVAVLVTLSALV